MQTISFDITPQESSDADTESAAGPGAALTGSRAWSEIANAGSGAASASNVSSTARLLPPITLSLCRGRRRKGLGDELRAVLRLAGCAGLDAGREVVAIGAGDPERDLVGRQPSGASAASRTIVSSAVGPGTRSTTWAEPARASSWAADWETKVGKSSFGSSVIHRVASAPPSSAAAANVAPSGGSMRSQPAGSANEYVTPATRWASFEALPSPDLSSPDLPSSPDVAPWPSAAAPASVLVAGSLGGRRRPVVAAAQREQAGDHEHRRDRDAEELPAQALRVEPGAPNRRRGGGPGRDERRRLELRDGRVLEPDLGDREHVEVAGAAGAVQPVHGAGRDGAREADPGRGAARGMAGGDDADPSAPRGLREPSVRGVCGQQGALHGFLIGSRAPDLERCFVRAACPSGSHTPIRL